MTVDVSGIDELREIFQTLDDLFDDDSHTEDGLLSPEFMQAHTEFSSFSEFIEASPWTVESLEDLQSIPGDDLDEYVDSHSSFDSCQEMLLADGRGSDSPDSTYMDQ